MAPLLFEKAQQAQFLKPAVITLVYGLGFGMVLVLLLVPALLAVQHDIRRQISAMRRGLRFRVSWVRQVMRVGVAMVLLWFGVTMILPMVLGTMPPALLTFWPRLSTLAPATVGLILFCAGTVVILATLSATLLIMRQRRRLSRT